jgi:hypothetical protein
MSEYHDILNIPTSASEAQIKNAYRALARKYHPDVSTEPDAEEKFIQITEAYDALLSPAPITDFYEDQPSEEELRRERARNYARMQYQQFKANNEAFQKSWYYLLAKIFVYFLIYGFYLVSVLMFLSPIIAWYTLDTIYAVIITLFVGGLSVRVFMSARQMEKEVRPYFSNFR